MTSLRAALSPRPSSCGHLLDNPSPRSKVYMRQNLDGGVMTAATTRLPRIRPARWPQRGADGPPMLSRRVHTAFMKHTCHRAAAAHPAVSSPQPREQPRKTCTRTGRRHGGPHIHLITAILPALPRFLAKVRHHMPCHSETRHRKLARAGR